jgi:hypothetical protein
MANVSGGSPRGSAVRFVTVTIQDASNEMLEIQSLRVSDDGRWVLHGDQHLFSQDAGTDTIESYRNGVLRSRKIVPTRNVSRDPII